MRIFIVGARWVGEWTEGVERAATALGHTTGVFYYLNAPLGGLKGMAKQRLHPVAQKVLRFAAIRYRGLQDVVMNRRLIAAARAFQPDLMVILKGETISRKSLLTLRAMNIPLVSWWVDDPFRFPELLRQFELFDMVYMYDKGSVADLEARGCNHVKYLPCACDRTIFYPQSLDPSDYPDLNCTIGFVAMYHPARAALLSYMKGWEIGLWGGGWEATSEIHQLPPGSWRGQYLSAADAAKVYNLASICPNVHHPQTRFGGLNTRTFEIIAAGGFELVDHVPGLEENFDVGREIVAYSSPAHFRELTEYYLSRPTEREAIIERGRARVRRDHTYEKRLEVILQALER